ncbi:hypothetical protein FRC04_010323 [Tulasnella sp. 424]|nr:hypothetical protein FRC04_010323 [Tulasnella sp. 424]KAG8978735.1 hypothetical protein FRC05_010009 [Tulasnella sp. 425]
METTSRSLSQNTTDADTDPLAVPPPTINDALPPELLLATFDFIYTEGTEPPSYPRSNAEAVIKHRRHAMLDVMLVCRAWHDLVAASPQYWTTVDVGIRESPQTPSKENGPQTSESQLSALELQLRRSGQLPIHINIEQQHVVDFGAVVDALQVHRHRWQTFNLLASKHTRRRIIRSQLIEIFKNPLPSLTSLQIGRGPLQLAEDEPLIATWFQVKAPRLHSLSSEFHLILPFSPSPLRTLTITGVDLERLYPPLDGLRVQLDQLVELRMEDCNPGAVLSILDTPRLSGLVVDCKTRNHPSPHSLPSYHELKELQWDDLGPDSTFSMLLPLCPNLTFFADYIVGLESEVPLEVIDEPPTLLIEISSIKQKMAAKEFLWPDLEEVLLDSATCAEITELIDGLPSVKRVRVLRDPTTRGSLENQENEKQLLEGLRERVDVAFSLNPDDSAKEESDAHKRPININAILPPELLINIFDILYQDTTESLPFPFPYDEALEHFSRHPLLDLMLVHRGWCNLVQTTPSYWTHTNLGVTDIIARAWRGLSRDAVPWIGKGEIKEVREQLDKSRSLPLHLTIAPGFISDFSIVPHVLKDHASRLETLIILANAASTGVPIRNASPEYLAQLLKLPLPSLKRLQMDELCVTPPTEMDLTLRIDLDAPNLHQLSSHSHLIIPQNPSHLTFLSVSNLDLQSIEAPFDGSQIELPKLLELRITDCEPGPILSAFLTPTLEVLIFRSEDRPSRSPAELPQYSHLRDLQWSDRGRDPVFKLGFQHCPNLTRYANYAVGQETEANIKILINGATILEAEENNSITWPKLEEVMFDCATCANLSVLVDAVPTIRRIRLLRDPIESPLPHNQNLEREKEILVELRRKVDVVFWLDPWTDA